MSATDQARPRRCARRALMLVGVNVTIAVLVVLWGAIAGEMVGHGEPPGPQFAWAGLMLLVLIPAGLLFLVNAAIGTAFSIVGLRRARRLGDERYAKRNKIALAMHAGPPLVYALYQLVYALYQAVNVFLLLLRQFVWG